MDYITKRGFPYLSMAFEIALDNVNWLVDAQKEQNNVYLAENRINKTYKSRYTSMMREIKNLYSRAKQDMKNNSEEDKKEYQNNLTPDQLDYYTKELLDILKHHMPSLLEHTIFEGVFY